MATKFTPKNGKVTGTKKKDKITWVNSKAWKKTLTVNANSGNDIINFKKSKYKNKLNGQAGNDTIYGGTKNDTIHGNTGADKLYGYNGADKIYGDDSSDKIYGGNGNDTLYAGKGSDYIDGGANNDKIYGNYGTNTLKGGAGNDSIYGGTGTDKIYAGKGNDYINAGKGTNTIYLNRNEGTNTIVKGGGTDTIIFSGETSVKNLTFAYYGNNLNISANGTTAVLKDYKLGGHSTKYLKAGNQTIALFQNIVTGNDGTLEGSSVGDLIIGTSTGNWQKLYGQEGNDIIFAPDNAPSYLYGGDGDDVFYVSKNKYTGVYTGSGNDIIHAEDLSNVEPLSGYYGNYYTLNEGNNTVYFGKRATNSVIVSAKGGNDTIYLNTEGIGSGKSSVSYYMASSDFTDFGHDTFIYQNGYTENRSDTIAMDAIRYNDIIFTRAQGSNDLVLRCGNNNDITFKDYYKAGNENFGKALSIYANGKTDYVYNFVNDKGVKTMLSGTTSSIVGTTEDDEFTTSSGSSTYVFALGGSNTVNSQGNDKINVDKNADDIINLSGEDSAKTIIMEQGAKATVNGVFNTGVDGMTTFYFNHVDTYEDIMLYRRANSRDLSLVTRNFETEVILKDVMESTTSNTVTDGNYLYNMEVSDGNLSSDFYYIWSYSNMTTENTHEFTRSEYFENDEGDTSFFVDGTDGNDSYSNYSVKEYGKDVICDIGGTDSLTIGFNSTNNDSYLTDFETFFHVYKNGSGEWTTDDLFFVNEIRNMQTDETGNNHSNWFDSGDTEYIRIKDYFGTGKIETVKDYNNATLNDTKLDEIKSNVITWLETNGFDSTMDAINSFRHTTASDWTEFNQLYHAAGQNYSSAWINA